MLTIVQPQNRPRLLSGDASSRSTSTSGIWEQRWGTASAPVTTIGNPLRIVKTENISAATQPGLADGTLNGAVYIHSKGLSTSKPQVTGLYGIAEGGGTALGNDVCALGGVGLGTNNGPYHAMGAYLEGRKAFTQTLASGAEITAQNDSGVDDTISAAPSGLSNSAGIWLVARGANLIGAALQIGKGSGAGGFDNGIVVNAASVGRNTFADYSSSTTSLRVSGTHTAGILVESTGGYSIFGGSTRLLGSSVVEIQKATGGDPMLLIHGANANAEVSSRVGNGSGNCKIFAAGGSGSFLTGTAAGDTGLIPSATFHLGGTTKVLSVGVANTLGFFAVTPVAQQTVAAAATDAATTQTLANSLRTLVRAYGLAA